MLISYIMMYACDIYAILLHEILLKSHYTSPTDGPFTSAELWSKNRLEKALTMTTLALLLIVIVAPLMLHIE